MRFEEILPHMGSFGFFQKRMYFINCFPAFLGAMNALSVIFTLDIPPHRCSLANDTYLDTYSNSEVNKSIPWVFNGNSMAPSSCEMFQQNGSYVTNATTSCDAWVFDKSIYQTTLTEKFSIVCGDRTMRSHINMAGFAGQLVGALIMGALSDLFGRRKIILIGILLTIATNIGQAFVPNIYTLMAFKCLRSIGETAWFMTSMVLAMELTDPAWRTFVGIVVEIIWVSGLFTLGLVAYFVRDWQILQLILGVPSVLFVASYWVVPESPRWLISRRRVQEARAVIRRIASVNGKHVPDEMLQEITFDKDENSAKVYQMFTTPSLLLMVLIIFYNWFVVSLIYYGLGLNVQNLSGNIYLNFTIANITELVSYIICITLLDRLGRKVLHCGCMLVGGIACICTMFPVLYGDSSIAWVTVLLSMVGKFGASGSFAIVYIFTAELYPTILRNSGLGVSNVWARVGGMVSPYIADLGVFFGGDLKIAMPLIVFGACSMAAGLLSLYLPETLGRELPDTIEDAKAAKRSEKKHKYRMVSKFGQGPVTPANGCKAVQLETITSVTNGYNNL